MGGVEGPSAVLGGGGLSAAVRAGPLWLSAEARLGSTSRQLPQGRVTVVAVDGSVAALVLAKKGVFRVPVGVGLRVGHVWLDATPVDGVDGGVVRGVRVAPVALVGLHLALGARFTLGIDAQVGWLVRGVRGLVDGAPALTLTGLLAAASLAVGVSW
jgi:hypothetical protein